MSTEEEAAKRWCPFGRRLTCYGEGTELAMASHNRTGEGQPATMCLGSRCMAWRWIVLGPQQRIMAEVQGVDVKVPHGYCGLAPIPGGGQ